MNEKDETPLPSPPAVVDLGVVMQQASIDPIWFVRGHAMQAYSNVEQSLCGLFAHLTGNSRDVAGVVFFGLRNAPTIRNTLGRLLEKRTGQQYDTFWKSFANLLTSLSDTRNKVAHWTAMNVVDGTGLARVVLVRPEFWDFSLDAKNITREDMEAFIAKCNFVSRLCNIFALHLAGTFPIAPETAEVFEQPVVYPPAPGHPLASV